MEFSQLFDHRPVLMHCPIGNHFSSHRRQVLIPWRIDLLRDPTTERAYNQAVATDLHSGELPTLADTVSKGGQRGGHRASVVALAVFTDAANRVLDTRTTVHGISEWSTPEEQAARSQRREAPRQWMAAPTATDPATLLQATTTVQQ